MISVCLLHLGLQLSSVLSTLPAPVNVSISSVNLRHVLHWAPGPGSPQGIQYLVWKGVEGKAMKPRAKLKSQTSLKLKLNIWMKYHLAVQAVYNQTCSPMSNKITFDPYTSTVIGPPTLSLAGLDSSIQGSISLPETDSDVDVQRMYNPSFSVLWRKGEEGEIRRLETLNESFTLANLEKDAEYCVKVQTKIIGNKHTPPSAWSCTFTSPVEPEPDRFISGAVVALVILVLVALLMGLFFLSYAGFICNLKKALPRAFKIVPRQDSILTPDRTTSDQISIKSETRNQRKANQPTVSPPTTSTYSVEDDDDDDDEEDGLNLYMDRYAELPSGQNSPQNSSNVCGNPKLVVPKDSESLTAKLPAEMEGLEAEGDRYETNTGLSLIPDEGQSGVQEPTTGERENTKQQEDVQDASGNVNLFSVTLGSLAPCDEDVKEEEQNSGNSFSDLLKVYSLNLLSQTTSQTEREDQISVSLTSEEKYISNSGYERSRCEDPLIQPEEEEEEEEGLSGYLSHR